ncbi:hypothetical protein AEMCBJ_33570 (plasmid) [Cupriavidus necator]
MRELVTAIPDVEVLLELEPEELAAKVIFLLRARHEGTFHFGNLRMELGMLGHKGYPQERLKEVDLALAEAFAWLEAQGLVVPAEGMSGSGGWRHLSRRAQRFENEAAFTGYRTARLLPRELLHPAIVTTVWLSFMRGAYATAVFEAMRAVEIAVREAAGFAQSEHGVPMARRSIRRAARWPIRRRMKASGKPCPRCSPARSARTRTRTRTGTCRLTPRARRSRSSCWPAICWV